MIPKKGTSLSPLDYRPSSLLSCVGKLVERVVKNRIYAFLENGNILTKYQSGIRNKRGTRDNLMLMTQKLAKHLPEVKKPVEYFLTYPKHSIKFGMLNLYSN
jgi:hypothetical protein